MRKTEIDAPTVQLMSEVAERRAREILEDVPRSKVASREDAGGVILNVEVANRPILREFIVPDMEQPDSGFVPSLLELRHIAIHCPSWKCEARELEGRAHSIKRAALEENNVQPVTIHGFRYGRDGNEEQVF